MGLFDVFVSEETCPSCGKRSQMEFQTKALLNLLLRWKKGDVVETDELIIKDGTIKDCLTSCPHCKKLLVGDVVIRGHRFLEVKNLRVRAF
jgi:hypothetical protein